MSPAPQDLSFSNHDAYSDKYAVFNGEWQQANGGSTNTEGLETSETQETDRREETPLVSLYSMIILAGLLFLTGMTVMMSEEIPVWISQKLTSKNHKTTI